jgi:hypothetical protein
MRNVRTYIDGHRCNASLWSTGRLLLSVQLLQDSPVIYDYLVATFARRFARGMSASFITTLLSGVSSFNAAGATAVTADDLFGVMEAVDPAYAVRGSWLLSWPGPRSNLGTALSDYVAISALRFASGGARREDMRAAHLRRLCWIAESTLELQTTLSRNVRIVVA